jgi:DNA-binding response OmpR family regulator
MKKPYVAIVDDDSAFAQYLRTFLSLRGYEARCYTRGDEMLASMKQTEAPDVVLLDVMMPKRNGYEVCQAIKADPELRAIPVIMLSAKGQEVEVTKGLELGAAAYVTKPFGNTEILESIRAVLDVRA